MRVLARITPLRLEERAPQNPLGPRNDFVRTGIARLVEVDNTTADVTLDVALERRSTARNRREVTGAHEEFVVVLEEETALHMRSVNCSAYRPPRHRKRQERRELNERKQGESYGNCE